VTYLKNIATFQAIGVRESPVLGLAHIYLRVNSALTQLGWLPRIFTLFIYRQKQTKLILKNMFGHFFVL
jgi:hypothetical protein